MQGLAAVITGDLIASRQTGQSAVEDAMSSLQAAAAKLSDWYGHPVRFTRFRGDGWQVLVDNPVRVLEACIYLVTSMRRDQPDMQTRLSAGIGTVEGVGRDRLDTATGTAFFAAGDGLDTMAKLRRMTIAGERITPLHQAIFALVEFQIYDWTRAQAEVVAIMLDGTVKKQAHAAERLGVSRQAVQLRLSAAGYTALTDALVAFEDDARTRFGQADD